jgi:phosphoserine phosphatase RsbU/P
LNYGAAEILGLMQGGVRRMSGLIDNVLDFAPGRLGGGVAIVRNSNEPFEPVLRQAVGKLQASWPERTIETHFEVQDPFDCDRGCLAQLLSNLLGNATIARALPSSLFRALRSPPDRGVG